MTALRLLTAHECHLCEHGKMVLDELGLPWREVPAETDEGAALSTVAPPIRPVLFRDDDRILGYGRLSLRRLRKQQDRGELSPTTPGLTRF